MTKQEAIAALSRLREQERMVGKLGPHLRRCKPGSPRHKEIWDLLTKAENEASNLASELRILVLEALPS